MQLQNQPGNDVNIAFQTKEINTVTSISLNTDSILHSIKTKSPASAGLFIFRVKDGVRTRDLRNHNPAL